MRTLIYFWHPDTKSKNSNRHESSGSNEWQEMRGSHLLWELDNGYIQIYLVWKMLWHPDTKRKNSYRHESFEWQEMRGRRPTRQQGMDTSVHSFVYKYTRPPHIFMQHHHCTTFALWAGRLFASCYNSRLKKQNIDKGLTNKVKLTKVNTDV